MFKPSKTYSGVLFDPAGTVGINGRNCRIDDHQVLKSFTREELLELFAAFPSFFFKLSKSSIDIKVNLL